MMALDDRPTRELVRIILAELILWSMERGYDKFPCWERARDLQRLLIRHEVDLVKEGRHPSAQDAGHVG